MVTLTPEWKVESEEVTGELTTLRKRVEALESMKSSREIDGEIYEEILEAQKEGYQERVKIAVGLASSMNLRRGQLTAHISKLTKYLVNAKLDHKSGVMDESALKIAQDSIEPSLRPLIAERNDLNAKLKALEQVLPARVSLG